jgi:anti-sigma B factor antagonist
MSNQSFQTTVRKMENLATIDLSGQIDAMAEVELNQAYSQAEQGNSPAVALNFSQVSYINSTGIALIVGLLARARKAHRRLLVFGLSEHYQEIFSITRLADFMSIYPDEVAAMSGSH